MRFSILFSYCAAQFFAQLEIRPANSATDAEYSRRFDTKTYGRLRVAKFQEGKNVKEVLRRLDHLLSDQYNSSIESNTTQNGIRHEVVQDHELFQGDIKLTLEQAERLYGNVLHGKSRRKKRKFTANLQYYWDPKKSIFYTFRNDYTISERKIILQAIQHWEAVTCLKFTYRQKLSPGQNGLIFTPDMGCSSNVGKYPYDEPQEIGISTDPRSNCMKVGVVAHEIAHSLGFWHETSRPDRDTYVDIYHRNVHGSNWEQFYKESTTEVNHHGLPYDYGSIMHYNGKAFANKDFSILTKKRAYQYTIGQRDRLSFNDVKLMNKIYCSRTCSVRINCLRGGYQDPKNCRKCVCPDGFTGNYCESVEKNDKCGGIVKLTSQGSTLITSPNYPQGYKQHLECSWLFQANKGELVGLKILHLMDIHCDRAKMLCLDYLEVRNSSDLTNTGMRFCCSNRPDYEIFSETNELLVIFRSFYRFGQGFKFSVQSRAGLFHFWS